MQRVSAVALVILGLWFLVALLSLQGIAHAEVVRWLGQPFNGVMMLLLCTTLVWHSKLGVQVVIEDYVHGPVVKVVSLLLNKFVHVFLLAVAIYSVFSIGLRNSL